MFIRFRASSYNSFLHRFDVRASTTLHNESNSEKMCNLGRSHWVTEEIFSKKREVNVQPLVLRTHICYYCIIFSILEHSAPSCSLVFFLPKFLTHTERQYFSAFVGEKTFSIKMLPNLCNVPAAANIFQKNGFTGF